MKEPELYLPSLHQCPHPVVVLKNNSIFFCCLRTNYKRSGQNIRNIAFVHSDNRRVFWIILQIRQAIFPNGTSKITSRNSVVSSENSALFYWNKHFIDLVNNNTLGQMDTTENCVQWTWHRRARQPRGTAVQRLLRLRFRVPPGQGSLSLWVLCDCQVEFSASGWSLFQRSPTECGVSNRDRGVSLMRKPWPTRIVALCYYWPTLLPYG